MVTSKKSIKPIEVTEASTISKTIYMVLSNIIVVLALSARKYLLQLFQSIQPVPSPLSTLAMPTASWAVHPIASPASTVIDGVKDKPEWSVPSPLSTVAMPTASNEGGVCDGHGLLSAFSTKQTIP